MKTPKKRVTRKQLLKAVIDAHNHNPIMDQLDARRRDVPPCDCESGKIASLCSQRICPRRWNGTA